MPALLFYTFAYADHAERRLPHRAAHLAHAQAFAGRGELLLGGPLTLSDHTTDHEALSLFVSPEAARAFAEADPYVLAGLVKEWEVREWTVVVGAWANLSEKIKD